MNNLGLSVSKRAITSLTWLNFPRIFKKQKRMAVKRKGTGTFKK